ncbi:MAG TPA: hypothetical protein PLP20_03225 [Oscillospiraceae bacterium]|nr:hypothetical protein [Oscillospiraceae bacterium]HPW00050.1 hypothetical protein [Oscillospiraceae bacterium]
MDICTTQTVSQEDKIPSSSNPRKLYPMPDNYSETSDEIAIKTLKRLAEERKAQENK